MTETLTSTQAAAVLALNNAHAVDTSHLEPEDLAALAGQAFAVDLIGDGAEAFLIALDQDADYDSPNFLWFQDRYERFVYIDRIVTAAASRGKGHARTLYEGLFARAAAAGHTMIGCEVNLDPPNPGSDAFHEAMGFAEVGRATINEGTKTVRYLARLV